MTFKQTLSVKREKTPPQPPHTHNIHVHRLTLEMVLLSCSAIPDKSASKLNMSVRPMWGSISSRLYVPEMENFGKCKSNRLERESDRGGRYFLTCASPALSAGKEGVAHSAGNQSSHVTACQARTFHDPEPPSLQTLQTSCDLFTDLFRPLVSGSEKNPVFSAI